MTGRLLLGGSFNPVHNGHLHLARCATRMLAGVVGGIDFIPCARPPHKDSGSFLDFDLRCALVESALKGFAGAVCNTVESKRPGPSYTFDTLRDLRALHPGREHFFLLGSEDFLQIPQWRQGLRLPELGSLAVAPRGAFSPDDFAKACVAMWPGACQEEPLNGLPAWRLPGGGRALYMPVKWLDISSTLARSVWLAGGSLRELVPAGALEILLENSGLVTRRWQENG